MTQFRPSRFEILPLVIKNLIIVNVLFFLAQNTIGKSDVFNMTDIFALHHVKSPLFRPWQLITHMFLHGNLGHIFFNMFSLWMFGAQLENLWGPKRFITFYFVCGVGAALLHLTFMWYDSAGLLRDFMAFKQSPSPEALLGFYNNYGDSFVDPASIEAFNAYLKNAASTVNLQNAVAALTVETSHIINVATLGASGAVAGVLAAFIYLFPNTYLYLYFFIPVKAKWLGLGYFAYELYLAVQNNADDNVARWAHIGGGIVGLLLVLTWNRTNRKRFF